MLGVDGTAVEDSDLQCLYTAPNWYQSHIIASNSTYLAYGARNMIQVLSHSLVPLKMLSAHPKRVTTVCFTGETTLVSGCDGGVVMSWDVETGEVLAKLLQTPIPICVVVFQSGVLFSGDDKGIVCVCEDQTKADKSITRFQPFSEKIYTMDCSDHEDSMFLAIGYKLGTIAIMSVVGSDMSLIHTLKGHDMDIFKLSWCKRNFKDVYTSILTDHTQENIIVSTSRDRSIKIWDGKNNKLIRSLQHPPKISSHRESNLNKEQPWVSLVWTDSGVVASSFSGDIACLEDSVTEDGICELKWKSFDSPHAHTKKVFAMCTFGEGNVVSTSMDRETVLWNNVEVVKVAHGLGGFAYGLDISPLSPNRIAVATGDNMVRIWEPYQNKVIQIWQSVRTKVMVIAWHPYREGLLSFGTEEGRVGIYDVSSGSMNTSSTYHEKPVYSMSWGYVPTKFKGDPITTGLYTCGGEGTIFCHKPKELGKPAINVNSYIAAENKYKNQPPGRSAVDWEFDSKILAVGCTNGVIEIFKAPNLHLLAVFQYHSRIINKLRWGRNEGDRIDIIKSTSDDAEVTEPEIKEPQILLASCSDDNTICVQDMTILTSFNSPDSASTVPCDPSNTLIAPPTEANIPVVTIDTSGGLPSNSCDASGTSPTYPMTPSSTLVGTSTTPTLKAHQTLAGHTARITDIDWNPHNYIYLVSTSYDGTAQVWNVMDGSGVSNFRGHAGRVFSVRWSHTKIDCIFTGSDEFNVRQWRISENDETMPPKVNKLAPPPRTNANRKKRKNAKKNIVISENRVDDASISDRATSWRKPEEPKNDSTNTPPTDQTVVEQPRIAEPVTVTVGDGKRKKGSKGKSLLPLASRRDHASKQEQAEQIMQIAQDMFSESCPVLNENLSAADIGLYSRDLRVFDLISEEQIHHEKENHLHQSNLLGIWRSDITGTINRAIETKSVTESLLSVAVMCGLDKYEQAVQCYISQLTSSRDFVTAASYLLILGKTKQAIQMLTDEECYREALAIAKLRLSPDDDMIKCIYQKWAKRQEDEMQFDSAIKCYLACCDAPRALMVMLRRKDSASLTTTLEVAKITGQHDMVPAIQSALEEALIRETDQTCNGGGNETNETHVDVGCSHAVQNDRQNGT